MRYCFNWSLIGSTIIEASDLKAARERWDEMTLDETIAKGTNDFAEDGVTVESTPGCFDVEAEG